ncbi:MAG: acyltransferase [Candidatus Competibacterales bacterium]
MLGVPPLTTHHPGIDRLGDRCRIADSVTVFRFGDAPGETPAITCGDEVSLYANVRLVLGDPRQHPHTGLHLGQRVIVNVNSYLSGEGGLVVEDEVLIGAQVNILSAGHAMDDNHPSIWRNPLTYGAVHIKQGSWIAAGATVLPGITLGCGVVVGAGSIVTRSVPDFAVVAGNPARLIRYRRGFEPAPPHRRRRWWVLPRRS